MIAHKRKSDGKEQPLLLHARHTARLCGAYMAPLGMERLGYLAGLLHDMGKASLLWQRYLLSQFDGANHPVARGTVYHAPVGAIFAFSRWHNGGRAERMAAEILALAIYGHHSGLMDAVAVDGTSPLLEKLAQDKDALHFDEAAENYLAEICPLAELDELFQQAVWEIQQKKSLLNRFAAGLLTRELLGALVDADRWDSACFAYDEDPFALPPAPNWAAAAAALEKKLAQFPAHTPLAMLRRRISDACLAAAPSPQGIYRLSVPTGGGKTLASLRYGLAHASANKMDRIFYIIPFNTILSQNAADIRSALGDTIRVLEHHSNVVFEEDTPADEIEDYCRLTERWRSDLVLSSMVQFLDAFYSHTNSAARRLTGLSHSVIIFDEVQALPHKCVRLFEKAVDFLVKCCGCTVLLCTATQPQLELAAKELLPDTDALFESLRRVRIIDETETGRSAETAASDIVHLVEQHGAVLMIVNTKRMAHRLYELVSACGIPSVHLSTDMVPAHRMALIGQIKNRPQDKPFFCVSTALIEAGVNISFPCVVRSLAGLGSVLQAAGRCNRNAELPGGALGEVHLWRLSEESLRGLPEIAAAQECTAGFLAASGTDAIDTPERIAGYYALERQKFQPLLSFPETVSGVPIKLLDLLGENVCAADRGEPLVLRGAYRTGESIFRVINSDTVPVLVFRGRGAEIATALSGTLAMDQKIRLLREAQRYSVSLFSNVFRTLWSENAIWRIESAEIYVLKGAYYNDVTGLTMEAQILEDLQY